MGDDIFHPRTCIHGLCYEKVFDEHINKTTSPNLSGKAEHRALKATGTGWSYRWYGHRPPCQDDHENSWSINKSEFAAFMSFPFDCRRRRSSAKYGDEIPEHLKTCIMDISLLDINKLEHMLRNICRNSYTKIA